MEHQGVFDSLSCTYGTWHILIVPQVTIIEPGLMKTQIIENAEQAWPEPHPAYAHNPNVPTTYFRNNAFDGDWKDPKKSAELLHRVAGLQDPPLRLAVGRDAIAHMRKKLVVVAGNLDEYETWSEGLEV